MKRVGVFLIGVFCVIYLLNPGAGVFELIPDNIPFFGNLDEVTAVATLYMCLNYFDFSVSRFLRRSPESTEDNP